MCNNGYDFEFNPAMMYYCESGQWQFYVPISYSYPQQLPWPDCSSKLISLLIITVSKRQIKAPSTRIQIFLNLQPQNKSAAAIARCVTHALNTFYCRGALGTRVNPDSIRCVWIGELNFNTLRVGGKKFFNPESKSCGFKTCGWGLNSNLEAFTVNLLKLYTLKLLDWTERPYHAKC